MARLGPPHAARSRALRRVDLATPLFLATTTTGIPSSVARGAQEAGVDWISTPCYAHP